MSNYNQNQAYPPPASYPPPEPHGSYVAPPPAGYPGKEGQLYQAPVETQSKGDGFWRGCCAGLCCCCLLDACF